MPDKAATSAEHDGAPERDLLSLDAELVRRAASGDRNAQSRLLRRCLPRVRRVTRAFFRNPADAEDATQTCLVAILKSVDGFRAEGSLESWAKSIAVRTTLRIVYRDRRERESLGVPVLAVDELVAGDRTKHDDLPRDIRDYLDKLPDHQRQAVVLHLVLGYTVEEVGELSATSPNTIKSRLKTAIRTLRKLVRRELLTGARKRGAKQP